MQKITLRLDDEVYDVLQQIASTVGSSATAYIQAIIEHAGVVWTERGFTHPALWSDDVGLNEVTQSVITRANEIDVERRNRSRGR